MTEKYKAAHGFLKHEDGKNIPFEEKPLDIWKSPALTICSIDFQKHSDFYNFYNSEKGVDDFFTNLKYKLKPNNKNIYDFINVATEQFVKDKFAAEQIDEIKNVINKTQIKNAL